MKIYIEAARQPRRGARPRADLRAAGPGQDHARARHRQRDGRQPAPDLGPGDRARRRPGRAADQPAAARRAVHRRDPPPVAGRRGSAVSGDGGFPDRHHDRRRPGGALDQARPAAVHPDRRHHPRRPADRAAARPLRHRAAPGVLHRRGTDRGSCAARPASSASPATPEGAAEIARRSRGTPRIANRLLRRVRDYAQVSGDGQINHERRRCGDADAEGRSGGLRRSSTGACC